jgi:uncharacterized protein (TIGR02145 family)
MKKLLTILLCLPLLIMAQAPQGFTYQGVATDNNGFELQNQNIGIKASLLSSSATGTTVWQETHTTTTDTFGLFNVTIGEGTSTNNGSSATFSEIDWGAASHYMKVEIDVNGGSNFVHVGTSQMMSVPYALYAENVHNLNMDSILGAVYDSINASGTMSVSAFGDTLTLNGQNIIVPGISLQNFPSSLFGSVTDIDGNTYQTVLIGNQEWMTVDLRVTKFSNGDLIDQITGTNNSNSSTCTNPGYIINNSFGNFGTKLWYNLFVIRDSRNICPLGWHVATDQEYIQVLDIFGSRDTTSAYYINNNWSGYWFEWNNSGSGPAFKKIDGSWNAANFPLGQATNESQLGFESFDPVSCTNANGFGATSDTGHKTWTGTPGGPNGGNWGLNLHSSTDNVNFSDYHSTTLLPCRCVKD